MKKTTSKTRRGAFKAFLEGRGLTAPQIYKLTKVPASTIYSFLDGKTDSFTGRTEKKIADALGVTVSDLYQEGRVNLVPLAGRIGAGAIVHPFDGENSTMGYVEPPHGITPEGVEAYEIEGFSMPPFKPGHRVFIDTSNVNSPETLLGEMCIVQIANGPRYFKVLRRGYADGRFNLESLAHGEPLIEDVILEWATQIIGATFR